MDEFVEMGAHTNTDVRADILIESTHIQQADMRSDYDVSDDDLSDDDVSDDDVISQEDDFILTDTVNVRKGGRKKGTTIISKKQNKKTYSLQQPLLQQHTRICNYPLTLVAKK
jgi:hypothetical protein